MKNQLEVFYKASDLQDAYPIGIAKINSEMFERGFKPYDLVQSKIGEIIFLIGPKDPIDKISFETAISAFNQTITPLNKKEK